MERARTDLLTNGEATALENIRARMGVVSYCRLIAGIAQATGVPPLERVERLAGALQGQWTRFVVEVYGNEAEHPELVAAFDWRLVAGVLLAEWEVAETLPIDAFRKPTLAERLSTLTQGLLE